MDESKHRIPIMGLLAFALVVGTAFGIAMPPTQEIGGAYTSEQQAQVAAGATVEFFETATSTSETE